jgi:hypothetical protein
MKLHLQDGSFAVLESIVQTREYRRGYLVEPSDAENEIKRIAELYRPSEWPTSSDFVLLIQKNISIQDQMHSRRLPGVMCIGAFTVYGKKEITPRNHERLVFIWLQEEFSPQMSPQNQEALDHFICHRQK